MIKAIPRVPVFPAQEATYFACAIRPEHKGTVEWVTNKILSKRAEYEKVQAVVGIPWFIVGCLHALEASLNFSCHLHNGDPLTARTVQVPKGRPAVGKPPFQWFESAIDALSDRTKPKAWSLGECLWFCERFNGLAYQRKRLPSPYLWSFTTAYVKGKFVADGKFDPEAVSKQSGVAAILKALEVKGVIQWGSDGEGSIRTS